MLPTPQQILQVGHRINSATEKVGGLHLDILKKSSAHINFLEGYHYIYRASMRVTLKLQG